MSSSERAYERSREPIPHSDASSSGTSGERDALYDRIKRSDHQIPRLQAMSVRELQTLADSVDCIPPPGLSKQELIFQILKARVARDGLGWGEGVLDVLPDGFGFLRSPRYNYAAGPDDIYVSPSQIRRLNLRPGHLLAGPVRPPKDGEKYFALLHVEAVNGLPVAELRGRIAFRDLTPILPTERIELATDESPADLRLIDLLAPIGRGQRALIRTPPFGSRTQLLTHIAQAILANHEDMYVILLVVDERPEEVTDIIHNTGPDERREVAATTFDEPPARHVAMTELALEKALRMVESGRDVVILCDSLTALVRAYNIETPHSGKILSAGLDAVALQVPKRLFGSARATEEAGTLTVIATVFTDTDSLMNDVIAEEFQGKAGSEIALDAELAELHYYPALDVARTGTRREENLLSPAAIKKLRGLRRELREKSKVEALEHLLGLVAKYPTNDELLDSL